MKTNRKLPRWRFAAGLFFGFVAGGVSTALAQVPVPDGSVRFLAFGDWGRDGKAFQLPVAEQMGKTAAADHSQFIVVLGDNFYSDGVSDVEARQWTTSFEEVYTAPSLQVPWYVALGNHDYHTNAEAEVQYTLFSPRWKMPARYYTVTRRIDAATTVQFFIIDSTPYSEANSPKAAEHGDVLQQDTAAQTKWLEAELKKSTAQWKIVCAHHPIYSCSGKHGDNGALIETIEPLLEKYCVQVYLAGHEHDMQHLRVGAINYFCSGAGSQTRPTSKDDRTLFSLGDTGGFLAVKITPADFEGRFIDYTGKEVYAVTLPRVPVPHP
jgi:acid phosphatase